MSQSEAEKLVEEVARKICLDMGEDPDCPTPYNPHVDFLWQHYLSTAHAVTALIVERCAKVAKSFDERTDILKISGYGVSLAIRSLSPSQPKAKEAREDG